MKNDIEFTVVENNTISVIKTYFREYQNLMLLLKDKLFLDDFGECKGEGKCATCAVKIANLEGVSQKMERNEPATLSKFGFAEDAQIRLACQVYVTKDLEGSHITIINSSDY